jgi:hypothetical protein
MKFKLLSIIFFGLVVSSHAPVFAVSFNFDGDQLVGLSNVMVDGSYYNVSFQDGYFIDLFGDKRFPSPTEPDVFGLVQPFPSYSQAFRASQALADVLFTEPLPFSLTTIFGIDNSNYAEIHTPWRSTPLDAVWLHLDTICLSYVVESTPYGHPPGVTIFPAEDHLFSHQTSVWAVWNPVPEPSTMLLFGIGMIGLVEVTRQKWKK